MKRILALLSANQKSPVAWYRKVLLVLLLAVANCHSPAENPRPVQEHDQQTKIPTENQAINRTTSTPISNTIETIEANPPLLNGYITFVSKRDGNEEIYLMNADGTEQTRLTYGTAADNSPVWSPDGRHIAFVSNRDGNYEIYVMNADGTEQRRLTENDSLDAQPSWSPDGKQLAFVSDRDGNMEIYVMSADGSEQTRLTHHPAIDSDPDWSPDGLQIAFSSTRGNDENVVYINSAVYLMDLAGTSILRMTDTSSSNIDPAWSPSSKDIIFVSDRDSVRGRTWKLFLIEVTNRQVRRLTTVDAAVYGAAHEFSPAWAPDGRGIAFTLDDGVPNIYIMDINSGELFQLTDDEEGSYSPDWWAP